MPDEAKLRFLAKSDDPLRARHAQMVLAALLQEKKKKRPDRGHPRTAGCERNSDISTFRSLLSDR